MSLKISFAFKALYSLFYGLLEIQEIIECISVCSYIILASTLCVHLDSVPFRSSGPFTVKHRLQLGHHIPSNLGGDVGFPLLERNDFPESFAHFLHLVFQNTASSAEGSEKVRTQNNL